MTSAAWIHHSDFPTLPGFSIDAEIGRGIQSVVYHAVRGEREFAIKMPRTNDMPISASAYTNFQREASAMALIQHPSLPRIVEINHINDLPYIVMEFVQGSMLLSLLEQGPLPESRVVSIAKTLASALAAVHRQGLIHRDIQPRNILISDANDIKLIDFGFVSYISSEQDSTQSVGTLRYSSPEQTGYLRRSLDARSDLYSLGAVLFECLAGLPPFMTPNPNELLRSHALVQAPDVRTFAPHVSPALAHIIGCLLAKDPDDRYQTAEALLADLNELDAMNAALRAGREVEFARPDLWISALYEEPLIGRDRELGLLRQSWLMARRSQGVCIILEGAMGLGKSHLGRELVHRARSNGGLTLTCACSRDRNEPYALIRVLIVQYLHYMDLMPDSQRSHAETHIRHIIAPYAATITRTIPEFQRFLGEQSATIPTTYDQDMFTDTLADLVLWMTRVHPAAVVLIDDAQSMDEASFLVIRQVLFRMQSAPLMIIVTLGDDAASKQMSERLISISATPMTTLVLHPLEEPIAKRIIAASLGSYRVDESINREIIARSAGNPFAIRQYVQTLLDAGMLRLVEGKWLINEGNLETMQLPSHVVSLVLSRIDDLDPVVREILCMAAMLGYQFHRHTLIQVWHGDSNVVNEALESAIQSHIIERNAAGTYHFSHQNIFQFFLKTIDPEQRQLLHHRIALALDSGPTENAYQLAHHYYLTQSTDPAFRARALELLLDAAQVALEKYAFQEAYECLTNAQIIAQNDGMYLDSQHQSVFADVCIQLGFIDEALTHLEEASGITTDMYERAHLLMRQATISSARLPRETVWQALVAISCELDVQFPTTRVGLALEVARSAATIVLRSIGLNPSLFTKGDRIRLQTLAGLYESMNYVAYAHGFGLRLLAAALRQNIAAHQLGVSREQMRSHLHLAFLCALLKFPEQSRHQLSIAQQMARQLNSKPALAEVDVFQAFALYGNGHYREAVAQFKATLQQHERYIDVADYYKVNCELMNVLYFRGYVSDAWDWLKHSLQRGGLSAAYTLESWYLHGFASPILITLGDPMTAREYMLPTSQSQNEMHHTMTLSFQLLIAMEQEDIGSETDDLIQQFMTYFSLHRRSLFNDLQYMYIPILYIRLQQAHKATTIKRIWAMKRLSTMLRIIKQLKLMPITRAHVLVVQAGYLYLRGKSAQALDMLAQAEGLGHALDAPWILFEVSRLRAYVLGRMGQAVGSRRETTRSYDLAMEHMWLTRARRISREFGLSDIASLSPSSITPTESNRPEALKMQRHLDALLKVSLAWANVFDSQQQMQIALDSVIRILGAERALLMMQQDDSLVVRAGRDAHGNDITLIDADYNRAVVDKVYTTQTPLVVGSANDIPSESFESPNQRIRSVLAAPLMLDGKCLGVIYLDNRLAWGFFSEDDVEILRAITNHVVLGLETARMAQLEITVAAEREQRKLAETMRHISTALNSSLDLPTVLNEVLLAVAELVPYDSACVALTDPENDTFQFVALKGHQNTVLLQNMKFNTRDDELYTEMTTSGQAIIVNDIGSDTRFKGYGDNRAQAWLGVPFIVQNTIVGFMGIDRNQRFSISERDAEIAMTFAAQAGIAITNARLFGEVQRLAISDGLTEIYNRRHFFERGEHEWKRTRRYDHPLSAMMIDIDYFKRINDTYSHATGDLVLYTVAKTCRANLRDTDILGRYGGEEFAVLLPDTEVSAAHLIAERLRTAIADLTFTTDKGEFSVTSSIGVAGITVDTPSVAALVDRADRGLYIAKEAGRNRVIMA